MRLATCLLGCMAAVAAAGCVSYANDFMHPVTIETRAADGSLVAGVDCRLDNDKVSLTVKSGDTVGVRRSKQPLRVTCRHPGHADAVAEARSSINTAMLGNVVFGGGMRGLVSGEGSAYAYPAWMQLVFGQTLVFDRGDEKPGQPTAGRPAARTP